MNTIKRLMAPYQKEEGQAEGRWETRGGLPG